MSQKVEHISCVRCKSYFFTDDDIVYCPICGAPHHRDCYNLLGHCALEELHGTDNEYSRESVEEKKNEYSQDNPTKADNADFLISNGFTVFDLLGGVPADYKFDDNVIAADVKKFVMANTHRYIPKFTKLSKENKISWNWAAFLFPAPWMFSRKIYKTGVFTALLTIIASIFSIPLNLTINNLGLAGYDSYFELANTLADNMTKIGPWVLIFSLISIFLNLIIRIICAIFGDYWYKKHTIDRIKKIKSENDDLDLGYRKLGGVNIFWFFLTSLLLEYIPVIIMTLI